MGLVYADIELISGDDLSSVRRGYIAEDAVRRIVVRALVDSGSYLLGVNETIKAQLSLRVLRKQVAQLADSTTVTLDVVGPVELRFANRSCTVDAVVLPGDSEVLLGAIPMEYMDVVIDALEGTLKVNPLHPYKAQLSMK